MYGLKKTIKSQQQHYEPPDNVHITTNINLDTIFPIPNDNILPTNKHNKNIQSSMIETNLSFSSSKSSNLININEAQQNNKRRRRHHQLQYLKQYPPIHYPSTIYITQYNNHNKQSVDDNKNSHILSNIKDRVYMHPKHISQLQSLTHQNNIWSSSAISKYCPLYPGIPVTKNTSHSSSMDSISMHNSNHNSTSTNSITVSYPFYSSDIVPGLNSNNIKTMDDTILCLTTNASDE